MAPEGVAAEVPVAAVPAGRGAVARCRIRWVEVKVVGAEGFEPPTYSSQSYRATRLRYAPTNVFSSAALSAAADVDGK